MTLMVYFVRKALAYACNNIYLCDVNLLKTSPDSMADTSILVSGIEYKIRKLIDDNIQLKSEMERLTEENKLLNEKINELEDLRSHLTQQINKHIIANSLNGEKEIKEGRKLIGDLVREIDQCIAQLSK